MKCMCEYSYPLNRTRGSYVCRGEQTVSSARDNDFVARVYSSIDLRGICVIRALAVHVSEYMYVVIRRITIVDR